MPPADKFTERVKAIVLMARQEAASLECGFVDTEHLLLGILRESGCVAAKVLKNLGYAYSDVLTDVRELSSRSPKSTFKGELSFTPNANRSFELAQEAACQLGHDIIASEHLLLAILKQDDTSIAITILKRRLKPEEIRDMVLEVLGTDVAIPEPTKRMGKHFISASCRGVKCRICNLPSTHKVGEEIPHDDPFPNRHNLTAYVCCAHFMEIVGPAFTSPCRGE